MIQSEFHFHQHVLTFKRETTLPTLFLIFTDITTYTRKRNVQSVLETNPQVPTHTYFNICNAHMKREIKRDREVLNWSGRRISKNRDDSISLIGSWSENSVTIRLGSPPFRRVKPVAFVFNTTPNWCVKPPEIQAQAQAQPGSLVYHCKTLNPKPLWSPEMETS